MDNLQKSELVIAKIVARLAETGLQNSQVNPENLELSDELVPFFSPCAEWLEAEGIIRMRKHHVFMDGKTILQDAVLTSRGFAMLGQKLAGVDETLSLGRAVKEVSLGQRSFSQIGDFFGGLLGGFTKSLGT